MKKSKILKRIGAIALILVIVLTAFTACTPSRKLKGVWKDSTGTSGYEFKDDNIVKVTLINITIPIINLPVNGSYDGTYIIGKNDNGPTVQISYTVFSRTIRKTYNFVVNGNTLTLTDVEDGSQTIYMAAQPDTSSAQ